MTAEIHRFETRALRDGREVKCYVEGPEPPIRPSYLALTQLLEGAYLIVSGKQSDMHVVVDWMVRAQRAIDGAK